MARDLVSDSVVSSWALKHGVLEGAQIYETGCLMMVSTKTARYMIIRQPPHHSIGSSPEYSGVPVQTCKIGIAADQLGALLGPEWGA